ncbi:hypothetical protein KIPB_003230 [Kipferlia bialata]|uniref:Uncharacterized protein n=1 Tax=Kipferlia bialata TaxID=797122 RepID=A0A9K3CV31_9EUKA|nr:hypothetical protein KIPB_003230 [Kipferlia bialata]|eukprot:g3230.t1
MPSLTLTTCQDPTKGNDIVCMDELGHALQMWYLLPTVGLTVIALSLLIVGKCRTKPGQTHPLTSLCTGPLLLLVCFLVLFATVSQRLYFYFLNVDGVQKFKNISTVFAYDKDGPVYTFMLALILAGGVHAATFLMDLKERPRVSPKDKTRAIKWVLVPVILLMLLKLFCVVEIFTLNTAYCDPNKPAPEEARERLAALMPGVEAHDLMALDLPGCTPEQIKQQDLHSNWVIPLGVVHAVEVAWYCSVHWRNPFRSGVWPLSKIQPRAALTTLGLWVLDMIIALGVSAPFFYWREKDVEAWEYQTLSLMSETAAFAALTLVAVGAVPAKAYVSQTLSFLNITDPGETTVTDNPLKGGTGGAANTPSTPGTPVDTYQTRTSPAMPQNGKNMLGGSGQGGLRASRGNTLV